MAMNMQAMAQQIASMSEEQREQLLSRMTPEQRQQAGRGDGVPRHPLQPATEHVVDVVVRRLEHRVEHVSKRSLHALSTGFV